MMDTGKRITYKRKKPNPLFEECLEKLYKEAKESNSKYEPIIKEAISSLAKYPLPLKSGADCAILQGFNKKICLILDKYLSEPQSIETLSHMSSQNNVDVIDVESCASSNVGSINDDVIVCDIYNKESSTNFITQLSKSPKGKYKPTYRSGGYAILMGLLEQSNKSIEQILNKDELIKLAQKYCDEPLNVAKSVKYSAWSSMSRLQAKGLVERKRSKRVEYSLTKEGREMATSLWQEKNNMPSVNNFAFHMSLTKHSLDVHEVDAMHVNEPDIVTISNGTENVVTSQTIHLSANFYDIILLIDKNEKNGNSDYQIYPDLKYESRSLKVGDFTWIARHNSSGEELVLPYIVERKRMDDLGASIKDGRFHEQKFRLRKCGLENVIYLIESFDKNKHVGLPMPSLMQALVNTRVQDGFKVYFTESLINTHRFLAMMSKRLLIEYKNKSLCGASQDPANGMLMTFEYFNKSSLKSKILTVTEMFIKMLLQLKGMSVEKSLAITSVYKTPKSLILAYESCDEKQGQLLLANLKYGDLNRNVGPSVSKAVFHLFSYS